MDKSDESPTVGAVLLNWNSFSGVASCLEEVSKIEYSNIDLIVVDNGSSDQSYNRLDKRYDHIDIIQTGKNLGFAGGHNQGIRELQKRGVDYVLILNNDVHFTSGQFFIEMLRAMENYPEVGIITPRIMEYPEVETVWFEQGEVNWNFGSYYHKKNHRWYIHGPSWSSTDDEQYADYDKDDIELTFNDYVPFTCALFRSSVFEDIGLLSEEYFLYAEDVDYCTRVKSAGYHIATLPEAEIYHEKTKDSALSPLRSYYGVRNRCLLMNKFNKTSQHVFYIRYIFSVIVLLGYRLTKLNTSTALAIAKGFIHGLQRRDGKGPYP